jgi:drug/metabolite transporter (DMT)-like permease
MSNKIKSDIQLLSASLIWGFAFVAQRAGMEHIGPFLFNGIRFLLGAAALIPFLVRISGDNENSDKQKFRLPPRLLFLGFLLFGGASLQQTGIVFTTAGKAGFITGLYVILVPILGIFLNKHSSLFTWLGALMASVGLYFLSITSDFSIATGDLLVLAGAFFWAFHVLTVDDLTAQIHPYWIAFVQFVICGLTSLLIAILFEDIFLGNILDAMIPILYAGILSSGIAYTLQIVAQKYAPPAHAAIILSLESPFAAIGGYMILNEMFTSRELAGSLLMLTGMILSQVRLFGKKKSKKQFQTEK